MSKSCNQKLKLLALMDILNTNTDDMHAMSMKDILFALENRGIEAARKSVYNDLDTLRQAGMDIEYKKEPPEGYYLASHTFEIAELKLLVDAVQSSKFITEKKSRGLIKKLEGLTSRHHATLLRRQVFVSDRIKTMNESIYYNVDKLHMAVNANRKIRFQYTQWSIEKKLELKNDGAFYAVSPWALSWTEENYYLIAYDAEVGRLKHFRVDKMLRIEILKELREGQSIFKNFDLAGYARKTFGMFYGEEHMLIIRFPNKLMGAVIDRFGKDVILKRDGQYHFTARVLAAVSEQFFGWLTGLGKGVIITSPEVIGKEYKEFLKAIWEAYE